MPRYPPPKSVSYTFTGVNTIGYDAFKSIVTKVKDSLIPVFLGLTHLNGVLSLYFTNESKELIDPRSLIDYDIKINVVNVKTGRNVYQATQKDFVKGIPTNDWESGIYLVQATIGGQRLTNKIIINQ